MPDPTPPSSHPASSTGAKGELGREGGEVDGIDGAGVGRVMGCYVDAESGEVSWLAVRQGRLRGTLVAVPASLCAAGGGRTWTALEGEAIRTAPVVDPTRPLLREHELTICSHYGIGEDTGRAAEVAGRPEGSVTSNPAS
jgi:hypothetical protein